MIDEKVLVERLEEYPTYSFGVSLLNTTEYIKVSDLIKIVNQLAEENPLTPCYLGSPCEYQNEDAKMPMEHWDNGWIPCSERLPEEPFGCLVTIMDCEPMTQTDFENILPYHVGYDGEAWNDADGEVIPFEVIAWMPLPAPFKPKGE